MGISGLKRLPDFQITAFTFGALTTAVERAARQIDSLKAMQARFTAEASIRGRAAQKNAHGKRYAKRYFQGPAIFDRHHLGIIFSARSTASESYDFNC